jgi:hypothetical protein
MERVSGGSNAMNLVQAGVLGLIAGLSAVALAQEPAVEPGASVVKVRVRQEGGGQRTATGFPAAGGHIVTTYHCLDGARAVEVLVGDEASPVPGLVAWCEDANLALLKVEWKTAPPAPLTLAAAVPKGGSEVTAWSAGRSAAFSTFAPPERASYPVSTRSAIGREWGGAPLLLGGTVVGMISGMNQRIRVIQEDAGEVGDVAGYEAARPELIAALKPGPLIAIEDWPERRRRNGEALAAALRARAMLMQGSEEAGLAECRRAVDLDERCWYGWELLSRALAGMDDEGSIAAADRSIDLMPTEYFTYTLKAGAQARLGQVEEAIRNGRRAVELAPNAFEAHGALGYVLQCAGDLPGAVRAYEAALKLNPEDEYCKAQLATLRAYVGDDPDGSGSRF